MDQGVTPDTNEVENIDVSLCPSVDESRPPYSWTSNGVILQTNVLSQKKMLRHTFDMILIYVFCYSTVGISLNVLGPVMKIIQRQINEPSSAKTSLFFLARAIGFFIGSVLGGIIVDRFGRRAGNWAMVVSLIVTGGLTCLYPEVRDLYQLMAVGLSTSIMMGLIDNVVQVVVMALYKEKASPFLQALHVGFALGCVLAPIFLTLFVHDDEFGEVSGPYENGFYTLAAYMVFIGLLLAILTYMHRFPGHEDTYDTAVEDAEGVDAFPRNDSVIIRQGSFVRSTSTLKKSQSLVLSTSSSTLASDFSNVPGYGGTSSTGTGSTATTRDTNASPQDSQPTVANMPLFRGNSYFVLICTAALLFLYIGAETGYGNLLASYAKDRGLMSEKSAGLLTSAFWGAFLAGRVVGVGLSLVISDRGIIYFDLIFSTIALIIGQVFIDEALCLWISSSALGFATASLYAALIIWIGDLVVINGKVISILVTSVCLSESIFPLLISLLMDINLKTFISINLGVFVFGLLLFIVMDRYRSAHLLKASVEEGEEDEEQAIEGTKTFVIYTSKQQKDSQEVYVEDI